MDRKRIYSYRNATYIFGNQNIYWWAGWMLVLILSQIVCFKVRAQDSHYWSHKFGSVNTLVAGADDATTTDNSAIINNPGGLGFNNRSNLSITTNAYRIDNITLSDGAGPGLDMKSTNLNIIPLILSGVYKHPKFPRWSAGYVLVDKERYNFKASQRFDGFLNVIDDGYSSGAEEYVGQLDIKSSLNETWAGIGVAYKINDHFSIGITNLGAYRDHSYSYSYVARAIVDPVAAQNTVSANFLYNVSYYSIRSIFKIGLSAKGNKADAGITVTLPGFHVYSSAVVNSDITGVNVTIDEQTKLRGSFIANDRQSGLKARFRSPASIAMGINIRMTEKMRLCMTGEYFLGLKPYRIIEPQQANFIRPSGITSIGSRDLLSVAGGAKPVLNLAIGTETKLWKPYSLLLGLRSNNSFFTDAVEEKGNSLVVSSLNIYHAGLGVIMRRDKSDLYIGVTASYGRNKTQQAGNLNHPVDNLTLMGQTEKVSYQYYSIAGILGYVHYIK